MDEDLVLMIGTARTEAPLTESWSKQIEVMRQEALRMVAVRHEPFPSVLLDTGQAPPLLDILNVLKAEHPPPEYWVVWCTLLKADLSLAECFLLVNVTRPVIGNFTLRFHLIRHQMALEKIEQTGKLAIFPAPEEEPVFLELKVPDLHEHLAMFHIYQERAHH